MSDLRGDLDEDEVIDLHPEPREPVDDGWGVDPPEMAAPTDAVPKQSEIPSDPGDRWDGWGDPPKSLDQPAPGPVAADIAERVKAPEPEAQADVRPEIPTAPTSDSVADNEVLPIVDGRSPKDEVGSGALRDEEDAVFRTASDLPADTTELSDFLQKVERSEAQEVRSLTEAEDYARENLGIDRVDFEDFDQRTANEVNATLEVLRAKYPQVGGLEYLGTIQGRNAGLKSERPDVVNDEPSIVDAPDGSTVASALRGSGDLNGIAINADWARDYDRSSDNLRKSAKNGGSAANVDSMSGVVAHEFGHLVHYHLIDSGQVSHELEAQLDAIWDQGPQSIIENVSEYAATDREKFELFAELFAEYQLSDDPRPPAKAVGLIVDRILS